MVVVIREVSATSVNNICIIVIITIVIIKSDLYMI